MGGGPRDEVGVGARHGSRTDADDPFLFGRHFGDEMLGSATQTIFLPASETVHPPCSNGWREELHVAIIVDVLFPSKGPRVTSDINLCSSDGGE